MEREDFPELLIPPAGKETSVQGLQGKPQERAEDCIEQGKSMVKSMYLG